MIENILAGKREIHHSVFNIPLSAIQKNGRKINYYQFISSLESEDCIRALRRNLPRIDMKKIDRIIDAVPAISDMQKAFYKMMLTVRKQRILDYSIGLMYKIF